MLIEKGKKLDLSVGEKRVLIQALEAGYDKGITSRTSKSLRSLVQMKLLERNPTSRGRYTQWRVTEKAMNMYSVKKINYEK